MVYFYVVVHVVMPIMLSYRLRQAQFRVYLRETLLLCVQEKERNAFGA